VATDENKGHRWAGSNSDSIPISILCLQGTTTVLRKPSNVVVTTVLRRTGFAIA
jgi:hypothetical protein